MVENLEDMWKVTKLQQERKARLEEQAAREEMSQLKAAATQPAEVGTLSSNQLCSDCQAYHMPCPSRLMSIQFIMSPQGGTAESPDGGQIERPEEVVEALKRQTLSDKESAESHDTHVSLK